MTDDLSYLFNSLATLDLFNLSHDLTPFPLWQRLAAPKPEAPPKWNLGCCKGLHETLALQCRVKPQSSLYYQLGKMYHDDHVRQVAKLTSNLGPRTPYTHLLSSIIPRSSIHVSIHISMHRSSTSDC